MKFLSILCAGIILLPCSPIYGADIDDNLIHKEQIFTGGMSEVLGRCFGDIENTNTYSQIRKITQYTNTRVNLRESPTTDAPIVDTLMPNVPVDVVELVHSAKYQKDNEWTCVSVDGETFGYIFSEYLSPDETPVSELNRWGIDLDIDGIELLAKILWVEARGESLEGQKAVAEVIFNRMISESYPDDLYSVLSEYGQFSSWTLRGNATPTAEQYNAIYYVLNGCTSILDEGYVYFSAFPRYSNYVVIGNHYFCREE